MKNCFSRRDFVRSGASLRQRSLLRATSSHWLKQRPTADEASPIRLGLASYTFRNFSRAQLIGFMKQLNVLALNAKDVKDHLPDGSAAGGDCAGRLCRGGHQASRCRSYLFRER